MNADEIHLAKIELSEHETKEYIDQSKGFIDGLIVHELEGEENGWQLNCEKSNGMTCHLKYLDQNPIHMVKGSVVCDGNLQDIRKAMMRAQTSELFQERLSQIDPMFTDGALLFNHVLDENNLLQLCYSNMSLAPGDVIWDRDMLYLHYISMMMDTPRNQQLLVAACGSIEREDWGPMVHLKRVRATIHNTGYVFRQIGPNQLRVTYIVQVDPRGDVPPMAVNLLAVSQAENASRMAERIHSCYQACHSLGVAPMSCERVQVPPMKRWVLRVKPFDPQVEFQEPNDAISNRTQTMGMDASNNFQLLAINFITFSGNMSFKIEGLHSDDARRLTPDMFQWLEEEKIKANVPYTMKLRIAYTESVFFTWFNSDIFSPSTFFFSVEVLKSTKAPSQTCYFELENLDQTRHDSSRTLWDKMGATFCCQPQPTPSTLDKLL